LRRLKGKGKKLGFTVPVTVLDTWFSLKAHNSHMKYYHILLKLGEGGQLARTKLVLLLNQPLRLPGLREDDKQHGVIQHAHIFIG
jgi:hypothetical protein